ncbi:MAG: hypothetical protein ACRDNL_29130 [Spirillospora sp.]
MFTTAQTLAIAAAIAGRWEELDSIAYDLTEEMTAEAAALLLERGEKAAALILCNAAAQAAQAVGL